MKLDIDIQTITERVYDRIASDPEGTDARAILGDATASILHARELPRDDPTTTLQQLDLPPVPFAAFRGAPISTQQNIVDLLYFRWFLHDANEMGYQRINQLVRAFSLAYKAKKIQLASGGALGSVSVVDASGETNDPFLNTTLRYITVAVFAV